MGLKRFLIFIAALLIIALLFFYWVLPLNEIEFMSEPKNFSFNIDGESSFQFYPNMRFSDRSISYKISNKCNQEKRLRMEEAFELVEELTILDFYSVPQNQQIDVACEDRVRLRDAMYIAGEGGPTNITPVENYHVILGGEILLLKPSNCYNPNVAIHELFHVLGFKHSTNKNNLMYNFSNCKQEIGKDILSNINELYIAESLPDLVFTSSSAVAKGRYLNANFTINNLGLADAPESKVLIMVNGETEKVIDNKELKVGYGVTVALENIRVLQWSFEDIEFVIQADFPELNKKNNKIKLNMRDN